MTVFYRNYDAPEAQTLVNYLSSRLRAQTTQWIQLRHTESLNCGREDGDKFLEFSLCELVSHRQLFSRRTSS